MLAFSPELMQTCPCFSTTKNNGICTLLVVLNEVDAQTYDYLCPVYTNNRVCKFGTDARRCKSITTSARYPRRIKIEDIPTLDLSQHAYLEALSNLEFEELSKHHIGEATGEYLD